MIGPGLTQLPVARARIARVDAARLAVAEAVRRVDADPGSALTHRRAWRAKLLAGYTAAQVAASMVEAAGTWARQRGHPLERILRDARCGALQPPTSDRCADWLEVAGLGGDPDRHSAVPRW